MLTKLFRSRAQGLLTFLASFFLRLGMSPNSLTLLGFALVCAIAMLIGLGMEALGGLLLIFSLGFDALDGAAARLSGSESKFGAFLDSTLDRWAESAIYFALLGRAWQRNDQLFAMLIFIAFTGSVMVSYTRARAEGIGVQCTEGWLTRLERLILIIVGLVLTAWTYIPLTILVGAIAVLANITAIQRIMLVYHAMRKED